jgi:hypothetical protein
MFHGDNLNAVGDGKTFWETEISEEECYQVIMSRTVAVSPALTVIGINSSRRLLIVRTTGSLPSI